jgi:cobalt-zinc-cadmium efflux system protein
MGPAGSDRQADDPVGSDGSDRTAGDDTARNAHDSPGRDSDPRDGGCHDRAGRDPDGHDHGGHDHGSPHRPGSRSLALVAIVNLVGFAAELAGGLLFGSVALLSDAVHMLFDALAYVMAWAASYVADRHAGSDRWAFGLHRLEPLSAFVNGALLIPMVGFILWESYQRFLDPIAIGTGPTLAIAVGGLLVNVVSVWVLEGGEMSLNEKSAFYHLLGDAGGSVAVVVSTLVVGYTGVGWVDPLTAGLIALLIVWSAGKLLRGSGAIFLGRSPVDPREICDAVARVDGVTDVPDFHAWQICSELTVASAHVGTTAETMAEVDECNRRIHEVLDQYGVDHATIELCHPERNRDNRLDAHGH